MSKCKECNKPFITNDIRQRMGIEEYIKAYCIGHVSETEEDD